jgi:hypothetical protein
MTLIPHTEQLTQRIGPQEKVVLSAGHQKEGADVVAQIPRLNNSKPPGNRLITIMFHVILLVDTSERGSCGP